MIILMEIEKLLIKLNNIMGYFILNYLYLNYNLMIILVSISSINNSQNLYSYSLNNSVSNLLMSANLLMIHISQKS
jgi:hypothetical protein